MRTRRPRCAVTAAVILSALLVCAADGCKPKPPAPTGPAVVLRNAQGKDWTVTVELARTVPEQMQGLMYRWSLQPDHGMLFIFPDVEQRHFWMKNTRIPLDMLFIGSDLRVVGIVANAEPYTETERFVDGVSKYVLEVSGGACARHGVKAGDQVSFRNVGAQ